jgi:hypothetical protein
MCFWTRARIQKFEEELIIKEEVDKGVEEKKEGENGTSE